MLERRGITPPPFIAWTLGIWTVVDAVVLLLTPWPILLLANILLLVGARRARHRDNPTPGSVKQVPEGGLSGQEKTARVHQETGRTRSP